MYESYLLRAQGLKGNIFIILIYTFGEAKIRIKDRSSTITKTFRRNLQVNQFLGNFERSFPCVEDLWSFFFFFFSSTFPMSLLINSIWELGNYIWKLELKANIWAQKGLNEKWRRRHVEWMWFDAFHIVSSGQWTLSGITI